jgi:hypothetical protein
MTPTPTLTSTPMSHLSAPAAQTPAPHLPSPALLPAALVNAMASLVPAVASSWTVEVPDADTLMSLTALPSLRRRATRRALPAVTESLSVGSRWLSLLVLTLEETMMMKQSLVVLQATTHPPGSKQHSLTP